MLARWILFLVHLLDTSLTDLGLRIWDNIVLPNTITDSKNNLIQANARMFR